VAKTTCKSMQKCAQSRAGAFFFAMGKELSKPPQFFVIHLDLLNALRATTLLDKGMSEKLQRKQYPGFYIRPASG
jgi:hypothetical protein